MPEPSPSFVTVTTTALVTGTPLPSLNATQIAHERASAASGQIIGLSALGFFVVLSLSLLVCWGVKRARRPPPAPTVENPDAMEHGKGAFLPMIGKKRKSTFNIRASTGSTESTQTLIGSAASTKSRRLSMWADEHPSPTRGSMISPPSTPKAIRHSSGSIGEDARTTRPKSYSQSAGSARRSRSSLSSIHSVNYGYLTRYHSGGNLSLLSLTGDDVPPPLPVLPQTGPTTQPATRASSDGSGEEGVRKYSFEEERDSIDLRRSRAYSNNGMAKNGDDSWPLVGAERDSFSARR